MQLGVAFGSRIHRAGVQAQVVSRNRAASAEICFAPPCLSGPWGAGQGLRFLPCPSLIALLLWGGACPAVLPDPLPLLHCPSHVCATGTLAASVLLHSGLGSPGKSEPAEASNSCSHGKGPIVWPGRACEPGVCGGAAMGQVWGYREGAGHIGLDSFAFIKRLCEPQFWVLKMGIMSLISCHYCKVSMR